MKWYSISCTLWLPNRCDFCIRLTGCIHYATFETSVKTRVCLNLVSCHALMCTPPFLPSSPTPLFLAWRIPVRNSALNPVFSFLLCSVQACFAECGSLVLDAFCLYKTWHLAWEESTNCWRIILCNRGLCHTNGKEGKDLSPVVYKVYTYCHIG